MSLALGVWFGALLFLIFFAILIVLLIFALHNKTMAYVFWPHFVVLWVIWIALFNIPTGTTTTSMDTNDDWYIIVIFSVLIFGGLAVAIAVFILVVLTHQDYAIVIPASNMAPRSIIKDC